MDVVEMYDYYFLDRPHRRFDDRCEYGLCEKSIVYRRLRCAVEECRTRGSGARLEDVLEYMLYSVSGDTGLPAHYSCCMQLYRRRADGGYEECGHVCNAIPVMIGSRLEKKVVARLAELLGGDHTSDLYDTDYLHRVYAGSFLVNGTFYYSVFRESNNNKICHNSKSKYRGDETVAYFYDNACNRGVKVFTNGSGQLLVNDRDGNEVTDVTSDVMLQLYKECLHDWRHYTLDMRLVRGFFSSVKRQGLTGIDDFKNKIYTNYSVGLNTFLDKLPSSTIAANPLWNCSLMVGKINVGISQRLNYPKSKAETKKQNEQKLQMCSGGQSTRYLIETQRRRNVRKANANTPGAASKDPGRDGDDGADATTDGQRNDRGTKRRRSASPTEQETRKRSKRAADEARDGLADRGGAGPAGRTILGTKDVKTGVLMERLEQGERNGPSTFNQVSVSYLPLIRVLSSTVQKLQVEHVHAETSKTVPRDAYGFICMKYIGNISTAGKNMLFTERVHVSYGHVHSAVAALERGIRGLVESLRERSPAERCWVRESRPTDDVDADGRMHVVINNAVTVWSVARERLLYFLVFVKTRCHRYAWCKVVGGYLCIHYYEGVPLLRYDRGDMMFEALPRLVGDGCDGLLDGADHLYFSRHELETLASACRPSAGAGGLVDATNRLIDYWLMRSRSDGGYERVEHSSLLANHMDQHTDYTAPAKRSVSVNARKSACVNVYYQRAADLIRGFHILVDPDGYERSTARRVAADHGLPEWVTLRDFARARAERDNCPRSDDDGRDRYRPDRSLDNFYMLRTVFADVDGYNVEDANILDTSVDLKLSYIYSFAMTFVDRSREGLDIIVPPPRNAACVCCWDSQGNPTAVLFAVCTIRKKEGDRCGSRDVGEWLRASSDLRMVDSENLPSATRPTSDDTTSFPPFRKLSVLQSADGNYHVYFVRNDAVLLRSVHRLRRELGADVGQPVPDMSNATRVGRDAFAFACKPEVNAYDALTSLRTRVTAFEASAEERVITVDVRVHGESDKYDGAKVVNSFGQKGLALIKDLSAYFRPSPAAYNVPVQLVMNNCSFVSRQPIGQWLQIKRNMHAVATSAAGEPAGVGYAPVFFTETEPMTKTCLVRFDEMMRSVIITLGMAVFQNLKNSLDNVYNPYGVLYPPQARQIMSLYRCVGVSYKFSGDGHAPFSTRDDVRSLLKLYDEYTRTPKPGKTSDSQTLMRVIDVLGNKDHARRLFDAGVLEERRDWARPNHRTYVLRLDGQGSGASRRPDYELCTYDSRRDRYLAVHVYGDPFLVVDTLSDLQEEQDGPSERPVH